MQKNVWRETFDFFSYPGLYFTLYFAEKWWLAQKSFPVRVMFSESLITGSHFNSWSLKAKVYHSEGWNACICNGKVRYYVVMQKDLQRDEAFCSSLVSSGLSFSLVSLLFVPLGIILHVRKVRFFCRPVT